MLHFTDVTADDVGEYLCQRRRQDGGLMRGKGYKNILSYITMYLNDNDCRLGARFIEDVSNIVIGIVRTVSQAEQLGEGNIEEGKREMTYELYVCLNKWLLQLGTKDAVFARA
jgi:hypothetical protein